MNKIFFIGACTYKHNHR